ncbi:MAG: cation:proton antiporter [Acidilobaceae archaeon]
MGLLELISLMFALAAIMGFITDRLRLTVLPGFLLAGITIKIISDNTWLSYLFGVDSSTVSSLGYNLLLFSGILIAFEIGREVGSVGFDFKVAYIVIFESTLILGLTLIATRLLGISTIEGLIIALAFISSSTITVYKLTYTLKLEDARRIALTMTTLEDAVLLSALSLTTRAGENPITILVLTVILALLGAPIFRIIFEKMPTKGEYGTIIALALTLAYSSIAQLFATPYLGAFIAGYFFSRALGGRSILGPLTDIIMLLYMISVGILLPLPGAIRLEITLMLITLVVLAIVVRVVSVFLVTLLIMRSSYYASALSLHMASISELSPLIAITAYSTGMIREDTAASLILLPLITISIVSIASSKWEKVAVLTSNLVPIEIPLLIPESVYKIGVDIIVASAKISGLLLGVVAATILMDLWNLGFLGILLLIPVSIVIFRIYRVMIREAFMIGEIPALITRLLVILVVATIATYTLLEVTKHLVHLRWIIGVAYYILIVALTIETLIVIKRRIERIIGKKRPPL